MGNLVKTEPIYIFACPNPFTQERKRLELGPEVRISLAEILQELQPRYAFRKGANIFVNGEPILEDDWVYFYPAPGSFVDIRVIPRAPIAAIVIAIAAGVAGGAVAGIPAIAALGPVWAGLIGGLVSMAISVVGYLVISAFVRPPQKALGKSITPALEKEEEKEAPSYYVTGARNSAYPYSVIPRVYGKIRMTPPLAALPSTQLMAIADVPYGVKHTGSYPKRYNLSEWVGEDQYLRMAVCWGYGPVSISNIRIGETVISEFTPYSIEHRYGYPEDEPLTLYSDDIYEESLSIHLTQAGGFETRTTQRHCDEISIDVAFEGLYKINQETGQKESITVGFWIRYKTHGAPDSSYILLPYFSCTAARMGAVRRGYRWKTDGGQYDVGVSRQTVDHTDTYTHSESYWTALRTVTYTPPVKETGVALTALYIKATDQLQGSIDELNAIVTSLLYDWDKHAQSWVLRETNNPASIIRDILMGNSTYGISANARPLSDERVHNESLTTFHEWCQEKGFSCNIIFDSETTVWDALQLVAATGRGTMAMINGQWGVAIDREQDVPVQHFTPRNSWDFSATQTFLEEIHGFRVRFLNEEEDYTEAETTVYMDGYDESNATKLEELGLAGVTDYNQVCKLGRYFLAVGEHRREIVTFTTDFEHLVCQRGDRVKFSHDVMLLGIQSGRLLDVTISGSYYTHVTLDEQVEMADGTNYNVRFRLSSGTSQLLKVKTSPGTATTLELSTPVSTGASFPDIGDLYTFGEAGTETEDLIVKSVDPGLDLTATIEATIYAPAVFTADTGAIPLYVPKITLPIEWQTPVVDTIYSDGRVLIWSQGQWQSRMLVTFSFPPYTLIYEGLEGWFRKTAESENEEGGAWTVVSAPLSERELSLIPVEDGALYEMKFRYMKTGGSRGPWTSLVTHTVLGKIDPPADVDGFTSSYFNGIASFKWTKVPDVDVSGYEIRYGISGVSWDDGTVLVQTLSSTLAVALLMPQGTWDVLIKAIDVVGNYSTNAARTEITITTTFQTVYTQRNLAWPGDRDKYIYNHKTGSLNPQSTVLATGTNFNVFNSYVYSAYDRSTYTAATMSLSASDSVIASYEFSGVLGAGESGVINPTVQINTGTGWQAFSAGVITCTNIRFRFYSVASRGLFAASGFICKLAKEQTIETDEVNISMGGTWVGFANIFYSNPYLQVSAEAASGEPRLASADSISTTGFMGYIHTSWGTATNGVMTYTATSRGE